jgi:hypothetical protein
MRNVKRIIFLFQFHIKQQLSYIKIHIVDIIQFIFGQMKTKNFECY